MNAPSGQGSPAASAHGTQATWLCAVAASLGGFLFGYDSGCVNGAVEELNREFGSSSLGSGFNVGAILIGCAIGAWFAGSLADRFGRRAVLRFSSAIFLASIYVTGSAHSAAVFTSFRMVGGLAIGAVSIIVPAYISEISPPAVRGRMACSQQMAIVLGLFMAFLVNYAMVAASGSAEAPLWLGRPTWRWMFWIQVVPLTAFAMALLFIPESPRWLVMAGRDAEAATVINRLAPGEDVSAVIASIRASLGTSGRKPRLADLRNAAGGLHPVVIAGVMVAAFQQFVGINVVFYYGATLWRSAGFESPLFLNVLSGVVNVLSTVAAILLVDRLGRRPLLLAGSLGMTVTLGVLAAVFLTSPAGEQGTLALSGTGTVLAIASVYLYIVSFAVTWGPVCWVLLGEMFPNRIRGAALAVAGFTQWMANFVVSVSFPSLCDGLGIGGAYVIYAAAAAVSYVLVRRYVMETRGVSLEDMERMGTDARR